MYVYCVSYLCIELVSTGSIVISEHRDYIEYYSEYSKYREYREYSDYSW